MLDKKEHHGQRQESGPRPENRKKPSILEAFFHQHMTTVANYCFQLLGLFQNVNSCDFAPSTYILESYLHMNLKGFGYHLEKFQGTYHQLEERLYFRTINQDTFTGHAAGPQNDIQIFIAKKSSFKKCVSYKKTWLTFWEL